MTPVTLSFLSSIEDLLSDVFNEFFLPLLVGALDFLWDLIAGIVRAALYDLMFKLFVSLLKLVLILEKIFDVFSCTVGVYVQGASGNMVATSGYVDVSKNSSILDVLMSSDLVVNATLGMTAGAFVLCFIVTIFAVIKSMGEGIGELKRPVSHVLRQTMRACLTFVLIPAVCIFVIKMAGLTITVVKEYMPNNINGSDNKMAAQVVTEALSNYNGTPKRGSKQSTVEKAIAAMRSVSAGEETRVCDLIYYLTVKDCLRDSRLESYYLMGQHFQNRIVAQMDVDTSRINWLYAYFEVGLVLIIMLKLIIESMTRIFMILILFVVSPYFVAMMPLDDGAKFKRWKEMFVGFTISVFGPILAMKTYLVLLPYVVTSSSLDLHLASATAGTQFINNIDNTMISAMGIGQANMEATSFAMMVFRLFFIAAGGYAVYKSQNLMLDLISPEVGKFLHASSSPVEHILAGTAKNIKGAAEKAIKAYTGGLGGGENGGGGQ